MEIFWPVWPAALLQCLLHTHLAGRMPLVCSCKAITAGRGWKQAGDGACEGPAAHAREACAGGA
jgi:hypothetical protein